MFRLLSTGVFSSSKSLLLFLQTALLYKLYLNLHTTRISKTPVFSQLAAFISSCTNNIFVHPYLKLPPVLSILKETPPGLINQIYWKSYNTIVFIHFLSLYIAFLLLSTIIYFCLELCFVSLQEKECPYSSSYLTKSLPSFKFKPTFMYVGESVNNLCVIKKRIFPMTYAYIRKRGGLKLF
jgi:hypothetical protein